MKSDDSRLRYSDKTVFKTASIRYLQFSKFDILVCWTVIVLLSTKFRVNQTIKFFRFSLKRFSMWRLSAILNLQNFTIFSVGHKLGKMAQCLSFCVVVVCLLANSLVIVLFDDFHIYS